MRLLVDSCVWGGAIAELRQRGHDVDAVAEQPSDPGDEAILQQAIAAQRTLITLDKDFGELAVVDGISHSGIVRLVDFGASEQAPAAHATLLRYEDDLRAGALVTVERARTRVRPPADQHE